MAGGRWQCGAQAAAQNAQMDAITLVCALSKAGDACAGGGAM